MSAQGIIEKMYAGEMLVFGHRGAMAYAPMNTLPAFELAAEQGAHGIELDVQRSKDGHPMVVHDFSVDHTSDGSGKVTEMTLDELKSLDAGTWFDAKFAGTRIPTLDDIFETLGTEIFINVEIKARVNQDDGVEQVVADCIARHQMQERVIVSSFQQDMLSRFRDIMPDVPLGFLYMPVSSATQPLTRRVMTEAYHPHFSVINQHVMTAAQENNQIVNAWTVNDVELAVKLQMMGVNGIITDQPDVIVQAIG